MSQTKITVSGMGAIINSEMQVIQRALEVAGFTVIIENTYPSKVPFEVPPNSIHRTVILKADHCPWGG